MLNQLYIRNFALIEELTIEFTPGLTIITGETGAGKSILIGALGLVLGARANTDLVRSGSNKAVIEAILLPENPARIARLLDSADIEHGEEIILRREISSKGQSRCFVNDSPCTLQVLKQAGDLLIDLHGQHEHQLLLRPETHISLLDDYAGLGRLADSYREVRKRLTGRRKELEVLLADSERIREKRSLLEYQLGELEALDLQPGEAEETEQEIVLLENAETLYTLGAELGDLLYDGERSAFVQLTDAAHRFERLAGIDRTFGPLLEEIRNATGIVEELSRSLRSYSDRIEFNQERLDELRQRQLLLQRPGKKYGRSFDELIAFKEEIAGELAMQDNLSSRTEELENGIASLRKELSGHAAKLSAGRAEASGKLERAVVAELSALGIPNAVFTIHVTREPSEEGDVTVDGERCSAFENGCDRVEFLISANPGEPPKPLARTASGGEISRIMLALKSVLAHSTRLPILVFDEIDTGISGRIAEAVGKSLRLLAKSHQIVSITHLPQIAAMADRHLSVEKAVCGERTATGVRALDEKEHVEAVAALFSGREKSESSLRVAAELVEQAKGIR